MVVAEPAAASQLKEDTPAAGWEIVAAVAAEEPVEPDLVVGLDPLRHLFKHKY